MLLRTLTADIRAAAEGLGLPWPEGVQVRTTENPAHGHIATNYALTVAKPLGKNPRDIATLLADALRGDARFAAVEIAGPGFVNLTLTNDALAALLAGVDPRDPGAALRAVASEERVLVELGSENVAKPMGVGHLRSNIIGMALARLWEALGATTVTVNHLGDWGTQFGKLVVAYQKWGNEDDIAARGIVALVELYQRFTAEAKNDPALDDAGRAAFRALEQGDPTIRALWERFKELSLQEYAKMYTRLNIRHDHFLGESFYEDKLQDILDELRTKGVTTQNEDGSIAILFEEEGLPSTLVQKSNGSTLYITRDLAALKYRTATFHPTKTLYLVGDQQALHFQQLFATAKRLGWDVAAEHVGFGMVLGESGKKMSTREGTAILLADLMTRAEEVAFDVLKTRGSDVPEAAWAQLARDLATAAIMYNDLAQNRTTTIVFNWKEMLSFDGDTAPYLLYAVARGNALAAKAAEAGIAPGPITLSHPKETALAVELLQIPDRVVLAATTLKPNLLAEQLARTAQAYSSWYAEVPVLTAETPALAASRLALALQARDMLRWGLDLLGLPRVERM